MSPYSDREKQLAYMREWAHNHAAEMSRAKRGEKGTVRRTAFNQSQRVRYRNRRARTLPDSRFLAYDGEGISDRYVLLANTQEHIVNPKGLSSRECLDFLTRQYETKFIRVFFAFDYDVTKILQDWPLEILERLSHTGRAEYDGYLVTHFPGKIFRVRKLVPGEPRSAHDVTYFDVWGFFQSSFLKVVDEYLKPHGEMEPIYLSPEDRETLEWGKAEREHFKVRQLPRMIEYNRIECVLLGHIMERLRGAINDAGMHPIRWHGPGVLAEILLDRARSRQYVEQGFQNVALRRAYFGGRIEILQRGQILGPIYDYDIRSAYPHALASFRVGTKFFDTNEYVSDVQGLYSVVWNVGDGAIIGPFPYRQRDDSIVFPPRGRGIYHACEVDAAIEAYGLASEIGAPGVYIERGRIAEPGETPFHALIEQWYEKRREHKARGDMTEMAYKLGLNSVYGKLAQRVGRPRFGDFYLAGFITAYTRAALLRAGRYRQSDIIAYATDGILSRAPLDVPTGNALGEFECEQYDSVDVLMSGIYQLHRDGEIYRVKSRGWSRLDFEEAMTALENPHHPVTGFAVKNRAFVTYKMAVHFPEKYGPLIGRFIDRERWLNPESESKRIWDAPFWTKQSQSSKARPLMLPRGGMIPLDLSEIVTSAPLTEKAGPSEDVWTVTKVDAESEYMLDNEGIPLST